MQALNQAQPHTNFYRNTALFTAGVTIASTVGVVAVGVFTSLALASVVTVPFIAVPVAAAAGIGLLLAATAAFFATAYFAQCHAQVRAHAPFSPSPTDPLQPLSGPKKNYR
ncbi:MAG: hypothetical protein KDK62_00120 [Chlamydiia bacterium]|nr:hypothetical protein [Chlamydiia bacterium]